MNFKDRLSLHLSKFIVLQISILLALQNKILSILCSLFWSQLQKSPSTICIHRVGQIGDMVCAIPALYMLHKKWPQCRLVLLTSAGKGRSSPMVDLIRGLSWINHIEIYETLSIKNPNEIIALISRLRDYKIDLWIALPQDLTNFLVELRNMLFAKLARSRHGFGFRVNTIKYFRRHQLKHFKFKREVDVLIEMLAPLEIKKEGQEYGIELGPMVENVSLKPLWKKLKKVMVIAPGANRSTNRWPMDRFASIANKWAEDGGAILIIGGPQDSHLGEEIRKVINAELCINLCGKVSILESVGILRDATLLVTNDSGPMHLASMVKTPLVAIFSARDFPIKWTPSHDGSKFLRVETLCSPCFRENCNQNNLCLTEIGVEDVWTELRKIANIQR